MYLRGFSKYGIIDLPFHAKTACASEIFRQALEAEDSKEAIEEGLCAGDTANCPDGEEFRQTLSAFVLCELGVGVSAGCGGERLPGAGGGDMGVEFRSFAESERSVVG